MAVAQYPTPDIGGPPIAIFQQLPDEATGLLVRTFKDGGNSVAAESLAVELRWDLLYQDGVGYLTPTEAAMLDSHVRSSVFSAKESFSLYGFNFRDPRSHILYTDVHYEVFEYPQHKKIKYTARHVVLVKRPM